MNDNIANAKKKYFLSSFSSSMSFIIAMDINMIPATGRVFEDL
jgi:hypothetical protein